MEYVANPVRVKAFVIEAVGPLDGEMRRVLECSEGQTYMATPGMLARMTPQPGDYVVIQEDNYIYLNPKEVFEHKYRVAD